MEHEGSEMDGNRSSQVKKFEVVEFFFFFCVMFGIIGLNPEMQSDLRCW